MKKLWTFAIALAITGSSTASKVYKDKQNGGFFGYKYVEQTDFNNGDTYLKCTDPGYTRCRAQSTARMTYNGQTVDVSAQTLDIIDETVMKSITEQNTSGKFIFDNTFVVTYSYDVKHDRLRYVIYLIAEAKDEGVI